MEAVVVVVVIVVAVVVVIHFTFTMVFDGGWWTLQSKSAGQVLFDSVIRKLQLIESDYFGLEYTNDELMPVSWTVISCFVF